MPDPIKCLECIYWMTEINQPGMGLCRRHAPLPEHSEKGVNLFIGPYNRRAIWAYTRSVDGCGEGEPGRKVEEPKEELEQAGQDQTFVIETKPQGSKFDDLIQKAREK